MYNITGDKDLDLSLMLVFFNIFVYESLVYHSYIRFNKI